MAWPSTPLTSYLSGGLPAIKAFDLNAFQAAINGVVNATYSLLGLVIDGVGGNVVVPTAGALMLSGSASGVVAPTTAVPWGTMFREGPQFGAARVTGAGVFEAGYNVQSTTRTGAGVYQVLFNGAPTNVARCTGQVTGRFNAVAFIPELNSLTLVGADLKATVFMYDIAGAPADAMFDVNVWGG